MNPVKEFFENIADSWNNDGNNYKAIEELFKLIDIKKGDKVLDLGCGKGVISPFIYKYSNMKVIGLDLSSKMIEGAKRINNDTNKYEYYVGDFIDYKFDNKFDKIIIFNAFPHFLDKEALAKKAYELLDEFGYLIIMHDLGKERLNNHHNEKAKDISCGLNTPEEEYKYFSKYFILEKSIDEQDRYLMVLKRA